ncbi:MAG: AarF/ABC1/UbiB kinase family protein [Oligoflexales bacterium]|nr:AarF/ABC1/UbiB kinase family protein [Oligoflexales bacterium]
MRLSSIQLQSAQEEVFNELSALVNDKGREEAFTFCFSKITESKDKEPDPVKRFFHIIWLLENGDNQILGKTRKVEQLVKLAEYTLLGMGIKANVSRRSHLYGRLYQAKSHFLDKTESVWLSMWNYNLASNMTKVFEEENLRGDPFETRLALAEYSYRLGYIAESLENYVNAETFAENEEDMIEIRLRMVKCLRILGRLDNALDICRGLVNRFTLPQIIEGQVEWEMRLIDAQMKKDISGLVNGLRDPRLRKNHDYLILASLWIYASSKKVEIHDMAGSGWLKRAASSQSGDKRMKTLLKYHEIMEYQNTSGDPINVRLKVLGEALDECVYTKPSEDLILFLAASVRCLVRSSQRRLATFVMNEYLQRVSALTLGRGSHIFGLLEDVEDKLADTYDTLRMTSSSRSLRKGLDRTLALVELFGKIFLNYSHLTYKNWKAGGEKIVNRDDFLIKISYLIAEYSGGQLRGPMQKLGQLFFNFTNLPEEVDKKLKWTLWTKTALDTKPFLALFEKEVGKRTDDVFSDFDPMPISIGSVSQVYRAVLKNGEVCAVKIQYPDLDRVAAQDIKFIKRLHFMSKWFFPTLDLRSLSEGMADSFMNECDFSIEADILRRLAMDPLVKEDYIVPRIYDELSTRKVLVMQYIDGQNIYNYLETVNDDGVERLCGLIIRFNELLLVDHSLLQLDYHPKNFLFKDDKIVCLDFGLHYKLKDKLRDELKKYLQVLMTRDPKALFTVLNEIEFFKVPEESYSQEIDETMRMLISMSVPTADDYKIDALTRFIAMFFKSGLNKALYKFSDEANLSFYSRIGLGGLLKKIRMIHGAKGSGDSYQVIPA